jgi:cytochrome P450
MTDRSPASSPSMPAAPSAALVVDLDDFTAFDEGAQFSASAGDVRNPYPALAEKRRTMPVELLEPLPLTPEDAPPVYVAYRFDDVDAIFRDTETFSSAVIRELMSVVMGPYVLVGLDEPEHRRHRALVSPAFRQRSLAHWEEELVGPVIDQLIDRFEPRGHAELVRELTFRFPVLVIAAILGVPPADHRRFHECAISIVNVAVDPARGIEASEQMRLYLEDVVDARRRDPQDDVISDIVHSELDGEQLGAEEIYSFIRLLLPAGAETTYRATGNLLFGLLSNPEQWEAVRDDRSLMDQTIEEAIRWESPLLITSRVTTRDTEVGGVPVAAGSHVVPHIGSANHDETRWDRPEDFDIFREQKPHISFAVGPHVCLGMHLARLEMRVALTALLDRLPGLRLDPNTDIDVHIRGEQFRSPTALPVVF